MYCKITAVGGAGVVSGAGPLWINLCTWWCLWSRCAFPAESATLYIWNMVTSVCRPSAVGPVIDGPPLTRVPPGLITWPTSCWTEWTISDMEITRWFVVSQAMERENKWVRGIWLITQRRNGFSLSVVGGRLLCNTSQHSIRSLSKYTHSVVESTSDTFAPNPQLPLARLSVPRGALVVPASVPEGVVETVQGLPMDRHRDETCLWGVGDPQLDFAVFSVHCKEMVNLVYLLADVS